MTDTTIETLVEQIQASSKYRDVCPDLIRRIGLHELSIRRNLKDAVKETKNTLHQVTGAFTDRRMRYKEWARALVQTAEEAANSRGSHHLKAACSEIMENHASTRERLLLLNDFYTTLFADIRPIESLLDIACGLNPLSIPWMGLESHTAYYACDLYADMMAFLAEFFTLAGVRGHAEVQDIGSSLPTHPVDVALVLKALPPLEQTDRGSSLRLLRALQARHMIVSFPTRTLGGHSKDMSRNYEARFLDLIAAEPWKVKKYEFSNELCFLVTK